MEFIKTESLEHQTVKITIVKEKSLNALNKEVLEELNETLKTEAVKKARAVILTGSGGKAFVAGADIAHMKGFSSVAATKFSNLGHSVFSGLEALKAVTIAHVDGFALGGGFELALSNDIILATEKSKFGLPEVSLGLIPGFGGTQRLSRSLGTHFAKALTLTGEMVSAEELCNKGLVFKTFENIESLEEYSLKLISKIVKKGPHAVNVAKQTIQKGQNMGLSEALDLEKQEFSLLFGTKESNEGISAFMEKREPNF